MSLLGKKSLVRLGKCGTQFVPAHRVMETEFSRCASVVGTLREPFSRQALVTDEVCALLRQCQSTCRLDNRETNSIVESTCSSAVAFKRAGKVGWFWSNHRCVYAEGEERTTSQRFLTSRFSLLRHPMPNLLTRPFESYRAFLPLWWSMLTIQTSQHISLKRTHIHLIFEMYWASATRTSKM